MDCCTFQSRFFFALIFASFACADEALVGTWKSDSGSVTMQDDGTISLETDVDSEEILTPSELGFNDHPDVEETLADLLRDRKIQVFLTGTWKTRGSRLVTVYQTAEVMGWDELVDDIMLVVTPVIESRQEGSTDEKRAFAVSGYRGLLASLFSASEHFKFGEETSASWSIENDLLTLGGKAYKMVVPTSVKSVSWGELKRR